MERNGRDWKRVGRMEEKWMMVGKKWGGGGYGGEGGQAGREVGDDERGLERVGEVRET